MKSINSKQILAFVDHSDFLSFSLPPPLISKTNKVKMSIYSTLNFIWIYFFSSLLSQSVSSYNILTLNEREKMMQIHEKKKKKASQTTTNARSIFAPRALERPSESVLKIILTFFHPPASWFLNIVAIKSVLRSCSKTIGLFNRFGRCCTFFPPFTNRVAYEMSKFSLVNLFVFVVLITQGERVSSIAVVEDDVHGRNGVN